ncbi:hypothetical protein RN001_005777 [Aquatica leii]|uniref:Uncharacterized protein n=1 Tax=Aquatica leii TaxID=1421715 RepID=A0AAN7PD61_9COLE|nr:hypothetical protein RN001_005777 [Aquatica leii]
MKSKPGELFQKAATVAKGISGFASTGIYPINPNVFSDEDFPLEDTVNKNLGEELNNVSQFEAINNKLSEAVQKQNNNVQRKTVTLAEMSPAPRLSTSQSTARKQHSKVLTATPEKIILEEKDVLPEFSARINMSGNPGPSRMHPDDSGFEKWCTDLLEDEDCVISDEDEDPDFIIESEHDSDSEMSAGEEGDENLDTGPETEGLSRQEFPDNVIAEKPVVLPSSSDRVQADSSDQPIVAPEGSANESVLSESGKSSAVKEKSPAEGAIEKMKLRCRSLAKPPCRLDL